MIKIDWKQVCKSPGYISLKAAYKRDVEEAERYRQRFNRKPMREKAEFLERFKWVISRAMHYAYHQNRTVEDVLNEWEAKRDGSWWLNAYQEGWQPRLNSKDSPFKGLNPKTVKRMYKNRYGKDWSTVYRQSMLQNRSKNKRWSSEAKKRAKRM